MVGDFEQFKRIANDRARISTLRNVADDLLRQARNDARETREEANFGYAFLIPDISIIGLQVREKNQENREYTGWKQFEDPGGDPSEWPRGLVSYPRGQQIGKAFLGHVISYDIDLESDYAWLYEDYREETSLSRIPLDLTTVTRIPDDLIDETLASFAEHHVGF